MSILATAKKPELKAPMITIIGGAGVGKTSLSALFPKPIILQAEEGDSTFDSWDEDAKPTVITMMGKKKPYQFVMEFIRELYTTEHEFKTVIVDSSTALNLMLEKQVVAEEIEQGLKTTNIADACGGYHKGYIYTASLHAEIIRGFDALRKEKGITVIFLGHSEIIKIKNNPDDASEYAVFGLAMHQKSAANYINNCDAVLYLTKEKFITGAETNKKTGATTKFGRATESGNRILVTSGDGKTGYISAKNRYDLEPEIAVPHGTNPLLEQIKFFNTQA
jgi:hypothetical protein